MKTTLGHSLSQCMEVVCNGKSAAGRETMFLKVRNFLNSAVNNQGEGLKRSFWTSTLFFFFSFFFPMFSSVQSKIIDLLQQSMNPFFLGMVKMEVLSSW